MVKRNQHQNHSVICPTHNCKDKSVGATMTVLLVLLINGIEKSVGATMTVLLVLLIHGIEKSVGETQLKSTALVVQPTYGKEGTNKE